MICGFRSRQDLLLENLALRQQLLALHAKRPRRRLSIVHKLFWVALRGLWSGWTRPLVLVTPEDGRGLASGWLPPVLEMALTSQTRRGQKPSQPGDPGLDLSPGGGESHLGRTVDSRRAAQVGIPCLGERFTMASTSSENRRSVPALADIPEESPRRHRGYGLLHRADVYLWRPVLLLRHRA